MALPTIATVQADVTSIYSVFADRKSRPRGRAAVAALNEMLRAINEAYAPDVDLTITDATDAGVAEAIATDGEIGVALGRAGAVGDIFQVGGTGDFTDDALETAKGSAPADGDLFQVTGADAVTYLGAIGTPVEMDDEHVNDFASKAGN